MKNQTVVLSVIAGIAFGLWPMLMRKGNVGGLMQSLILSSFTVITVVVLNILYPPQALNVKPLFAIAGGIVATIGVVFYTTALSKANELKINLSTIVLLQIIMQVMVPVLFQVILDGVGISKEKLAGIFFGVLAIICLVK
jgi:drug/metabolite transporter (DMT)-like permease